jgi:site-specific DNA-cytosine methylase
MMVLDLFSCVGCHAIGMARTGHETVAMCEVNPYRRAVLERHFPEVPVHDDIRTFAGLRADVAFGGPPCQKTSVAAAIHGRRSGETYWPDMLRVGLASSVDWFVVEQPPGNAEWETNVAGDLSGAGFHVARLEFAACDIGAPFERRRVFILACTSMSRLAVAWSAGPSAIERVKRSADARGTWDPDKLLALRVDARSAGEMDRGAQSRERRERIEALGDSNPAEMAEVIGICLAEAALPSLTAIPNQHEFPHARND